MYTRWRDGKDAVAGARVDGITAGEAAKGGQKSHVGAKGKARKTYLCSSALAQRDHRVQMAGEPIASVHRAGFVRQMAADKGWQCKTVASVDNIPLGGRRPGMAVVIATHQHDLKRCL